MTVEEALVALLAAVAGILLFLGLAQALDNRPPRAVRRQQGRDDRIPERGYETVPVPPAAALTLPVERPRIEVPPPPPDAAPAYGGEESRQITEGRAEAAEPAPTDEMSGAIGEESERNPVGACAKLFVAGKYAELLVTAEPLLAGPPEATASYDVAALWSLVTLSRDAMGDEPQAHAALAAAGRALPETVIDRHPPWLATMTLPIARGFLHLADRLPQTAAERIAAHRLAAFWLRSQLVAAPEDQAAQGLLQATRDALSEAYADVTTALVKSEQWTDARRIIGQGLESGDVAAPRGELLMEFLAASVRTVVERITAPIMRGAKDEAKAVSGLERAEGIVSSLAGAELPPRQWASMTRRIWRGYATLGARRLKAGDVDGAAAALFRALGMKEIGRRRQRQVRETVVRMLEAMGDQKMDAVAALLANGDRAAAALHVEQLTALIQSAREGGVAQEELAVAATKAKVLTHQLESSTA